MSLIITFLFLMSIGNHLYPVKADSKRNEESLHLKQQLYTVNMHLELDNKHVSLHQLLKMVKNRTVVNQTRYKGNLFYTYQ